MIKGIDFAIHDDVNYKSEFDDFDILFKKLVLDFKDVLNDDDDMQVEGKTIKDDVQVEI
jgi:hypothetical protein